MYVRKSQEKRFWKKPGNIKTFQRISLAVTKPNNLKVKESSLRYEIKLNTYCLMIF